MAWTALLKSSRGHWRSNRRYLKNTAHTYTVQYIHVECVCRYIQTDRQGVVDRERTGKNRLNYGLNNFKRVQEVTFTTDEVDAGLASSLEIWPAVLAKAAGVGGTCGVPGHPQ